MAASSTKSKRRPGSHQLYLGVDGGGTKTSIAIMNEAREVQCEGFAGPSNPREFAGMIGNGFLNPVNYPSPFLTSLGRGAALGLDARERNIETLEDLRTNSLDTYARLRSLWRQHRDAELGRATETEPDVLEDPGEDALDFDEDESDPA